MMPYNGRCMSTKRVLLLVAITALVIFGYTFRADLVEAVEVMRSVHWGWLLLLIPIMATNFLAHALFFRSALRAIGVTPPPLRRLFGLALAVAFTNVIAPSAGAAGVSLMATTLRKDGVKAGQSTFIQLARYAAVYASYTLLLVVALLALLIGEGATIASIVLVSALVLNILIVTGVGVYLVYDRRAFRWLFSTLQRLVDWVARKFRGGRDLVGVERIERVTDDFFSGVKQIVKDRSYFKQPFWWSLSGNIIEVTSLFVVFIALDFVVNPGAVIVAFAVASGAGILTLIPGDVGIYELAMVATFSLAGVPLAVGISATILFRVISRLIILPFGFFFYNRYINEVTNGTNS